MALALFCGYVYFMMQFPTGTITLVFTDIQGSSALWEAHGDAFAPVLNAHNTLLRAVAAQWNGIEVKTEGDAFFLVFQNAADAVRFAVAAQNAIASHHWNNLINELDELRVRIGMHSGAPIIDRHPNGETDYFGPVVNRAARVGGAGHGGQIVISNATLELAQNALPPEIVAENLGRHRLKGVGEEILWQINHPQLPARFPPLKTLSGAKHNLPSATSPFVGREKDLEKMLAQLRGPETRLLTLLGFGGHGKTRLALQLAELSMDDFDDGVWWIELEDAHNADEMNNRIAHELRLHLSPQPTVREQLLEFHRDRQMLLVLDNLEQIPDAGRVVLEILQSAPRVKCLVTTRRALEIRPERVIEVAPMPFGEAAQLFTDRARSRVPDFEMNAGNRQDIQELCRRLEGVPLAIELAASRAAVLTPSEMIERLDERFRLLQTRAPDLPPRQRALRGAIDWSYDLLNEEDQALFAQLSVFTGGFTMDAAETICEQFDALEGIAELRRQSLLRAEEVGGKLRFIMLESVRVYAAEKLEDAPDASEIRRAHAAYFAKFAQKRAAQIRTRDEQQALDEFFVERANLDAALRYLCDNKKVKAAPLVLHMQDLLHRMGFWEEARAVLQRGWQIVAVDDRAMRAQLQLRMASLAHDQGEADAQQKAEAALSECENLGDKAGQATALNLLGLLATDQEKPAAARENFEKSLTLREASDHQGRAIALHNLARLASQQKDYDLSRQLYEEALIERRAGGDVRGEAETLGNLGAIAFNRNDSETAQRLYRESLQLRRGLRDRMGIAFMLFNLAEIAEVQGDAKRAVVLYVQSHRLFRELGSPYASAASSALQNLAAHSDFATGRREAEDADWSEWI